MASEAIQFDTHKFVKRLIDAGFDEKQAEVLADEQVNLINTNLATKTDIEALRLSTKSDIEALRLSTKADIESVKADIEALRLSTKADIESVRADLELGLATLKGELQRWMIGISFAQAGLIVALIKLI